MAIPPSAVSIDGSRASSDRAARSCSESADPLRAKAVTNNDAVKGPTSRPATCPGAALSPAFRSVPPTFSRNAVRIAGSLRYDTLGRIFKIASKGSSGRRNGTDEHDSLPLLREGIAPLGIGSLAPIRNRMDSPSFGHAPFQNAPIGTASQDGVTLTWIHQKDREACSDPPEREGNNVVVGYHRQTFPVCGHGLLAEFIGRVPDGRKDSD